MPVPQNGWVKFHRQALRPESSLMLLDKMAQLAFLKYVMLARWQEPYRGCLCDPDGKPWSREQRAAALQIGYSTMQRVEAAMIEAGLIIIDKRGRTSHHDSQGRLRILNYSTFQQPSEMEASDSADGAQPPEVEASASQDGGCQPSKVEASTLGNSASQDGGLEAGAPTGTGASGENTLEETASQDGGLDLQEVRRKKLRKNTNGGGTLPEGSASREGKPNGQQPSADSLNLNDNETPEETISRACAILAPFSKDQEATVRTAMESSYNAYPEQLIEAAHATAMTGSRDANASWRTLYKYFHSTIANKRADAKDANAADPMRRPFVLLFGVEPHTPVDRANWNDNLRKFRHWPQEFIRRQEMIHSRSNPAYWEGLRAKATALGFWWDGVKPYLEAARQRHNRIEVTPGVRQRYETEQMAELDGQIAKLEEELALE